MKAFSLPRRMGIVSGLLLSSLAAAGLLPAAAQGAEITLAENGKSRCVVHATPRVMADDLAVPQQDEAATRAEQDRRRLRESVRDLALYLRKMSGVAVGIETNAGPAGADVVILIGEVAQEHFGPVGIEVFGKQGYRVAVKKDRVGLYGESDLAASYAIYDVLDGLGCRWYMPGDLGEVIPQLTTVSLAEQDRTGGPFTYYRGIWYADEAYKRRNRCGGFLINAGHALEGYVSEDLRKQHPEWRAISDGKPQARRLKWSLPGVAEALADGIIASLEKRTGVTSVSLSPDDGMGYDETDDKTLDAGDFDSSIAQVSITDRQVWLCNRIIERVDKKFPGIRYGMLAYGASTRPPVREKPHPLLVPQIAPITFRRAHPMTDDRVPDNKELRALIEGWAKLCPEISYYYYGWFLAEPSAPNPFLTKWGVDVPIALKNNGRYWQPETLANFETTLHALYMSLRLAWDPKQDPQAIYDEINTRFYGQAGPAMKRYWELVDQTWTGTPEYSGCGFGHMRRFPPEALAKWRAALDEALAACQTVTEYRRVKMADESLRLFELFMKMRRDLAEGRWTTLEPDARKYLGAMAFFCDEYAANYAFGKTGWSWGGSINSSYFRSFYKATYDDAARLANPKEATLLLRKPLREFRYKDDPEKTGEVNGWARADFNDAEWPVTDVCMQTWSSLGLHAYMGTVWYRARVKVGKLPEGKPVKLWIGATDGSAKVFVNGAAIPYVDKTGKTNDVAQGYCQPFSFDVTGALKPDAENQVTIQATRTFINELGTGGLLAPVTLYHE
jgi:hypothetical protein